MHLTQRTVNNMNRIYIQNEEDWLLNEINMALDDAGIDYDIDGGGRYLINDDNIDTAIDIMENLGAYTECI